MAETVYVFREQGLVKRELERERERTEAELRRHKGELEVLVAERTAQLSDANTRLQIEVDNYARARDRAESANQAKSEFLSCPQSTARTGPSSPVAHSTNSSPRGVSRQSRVRRKTSCVEFIGLQASPPRRRPGRRRSRPRRLPISDGGARSPSSPGAKL